jgi:hypothetical protein
MYLKRLEFGFTTHIGGATSTEYNFTKSPVIIAMSTYMYPSDWPMLN